MMRAVAAAQAACHARAISRRIPPSDPVIKAVERDGFYLARGGGAILPNP
jgi:hypothetical protein